MCRVSVEADIKNGNANVTVEMRLSLIKTHWLMEALKNCHDWENETWRFDGETLW